MCLWGSLKPSTFTHLPLLSLLRPNIIIIERLLLSCGFYKVPAAWLPFGLDRGLLRGPCRPPPSVWCWQKTTLAEKSTLHKSFQRSSYRQSPAPPTNTTHLPPQKTPTAPPSSSFISLPLHCFFVLA